MTQQELEAVASAAAWDDVEGYNPEDDVRLPRESDGPLDLDLVCEGLVGRTPAEADEELRSALRSLNPENLVSDADVLGGLLRVFRLVRDYALEDGDLELATAYGDHLTGICDRNFGIAMGAESAGVSGSHFPPHVVAPVYFESGRTFALAGELSKARCRLEKALNVFDIVQGVEALEEGFRRQVAAATASLARVLYRIGSDDGDTASVSAQDTYLKALDLYANLPTNQETIEFIVEYTELLGRAGGEYLTPVTLSLISELAEQKFTNGSPEHLRTLVAIGKACREAGHLELAAPALLLRSEILRATAGSSLSRISDADKAEDEAACAFEAAIPLCLEEEDLEGAVEAWAAALRLRESIDPQSAVVEEMRASLAMLREAAAQQAEAAAALREQRGAPAADDGWDS